MPYAVVTEQEFDTIGSLSKEDRELFVFLEDHPTHERHWTVECLNPKFIKDFKGILKRRVVNPFTYPRFEECAKAKGYTVRWLSDPTEHFEWAASLFEVPDVTIESDQVGTVHGLWPFQIQGYNFLKDLRGGVANWSTGTGKTVLAAALTKHHHDHDHYDLCLWVCKPNNKTNSQRAIKKLVGLHSEVVKNSPLSRHKQYIDLATRADAGEKPILIVNYDKFRDDEEHLAKLIQDRRLWVVFDEMPSKLKHRGSKIYKATCRVFYTSATTRSPRVEWKSLRPIEMRSVMLSATPIDHSPMDFFNCVRILDPSRYGPVENFNNTYIRSWSPYASGVVTAWQNLPLMGEVAAQFTHQVDKDDPDIAIYFPENLEDSRYIDLQQKHREIYDRLMDEYIADEIFDTDSILAKIGVAQRLLDCPELLIGDIENSELAAKFIEVVGMESLARAKSTKLIELEDDLMSFKGRKGLVFSTYSTMLPHLAKVARKCGIGYVLYHGGLSARKRQEAQDKFENDPDCQLFISTDAGGDALDFPFASFTIHYDLGWSWAGKKQRENRQNRIVSTHEKQSTITYIVPDSVEDRKIEIISKKYGYHQKVFKGTISELSGGARLTKGDLYYVLTGKSAH